MPLNIGRGWFPRPGVRRLTGVSLPPLRRRAPFILRRTSRRPEPLLLR
jgi:hypothetical protein